MTIVSSVATYAQETIFRNFSSLQYKGGTQNWDIEQLPDGRMAIANNVGVLIYDGAGWSVNPIRNYSTVRSLYFEHTTGRLYAGASGEFGYYQVNPMTYQLQYHSISDKISKKVGNFGEIWKILPWRDKLVFQSKSHLFILGKDGKVHTYQAHNRIEAVIQVENHLIMASRCGLEEYVGGHSRVLPYATFSGQTIVRAIASYRKTLFVATQQNGIFTYDGKNLVPAFPDLASIFRDNHIFCMKVCGDKLAVGTVKAGLVVIDLMGGADFIS